MAEAECLDITSRSSALLWVEGVSLVFTGFPWGPSLSTAFCFTVSALPLSSLRWAGGYNITPCVMAVTIQNPWCVLIALPVLLRGRRGRHCPSRTKPYKVRRPPFAVQSDFLVIKLCWLVHPLRIRGRLEMSTWNTPQDVHSFLLGLKPVTFITVKINLVYVITDTMISYM